MRADKYLKHLIEPVFNRNRTREIFSYNPGDPAVRQDSKDIKICVYNYSESNVEDHEVESVEETFEFRDNKQVTWINMDGLNKAAVEAICNHFDIHPLLVEDILSIGQRPKMDEYEGVIFCLLNMLYFNKHECKVEQEQISIVAGKDFVITFQEDADRDVFDNIRLKLKQHGSRLRQRGADYLCYSLLDMIVDHYFSVMESLGDKIETLEEEVIRIPDKATLTKVNALRKELIALKRNVTPVRDLINNITRSDSDLIDIRTLKYFNDVRDHIIQANDVVENYRDIMTNLQDLYISQVNLKLNEVMKVMAIVTCLLAPATVIGGIFGMNFQVIPYAHQRWGFYVTVGLMVIIPIIMLRIFRKRGWF